MKKTQLTDLERLAVRARPKGQAVIHQVWGKLLFIHWRMGVDSKLLDFPDEGHWVLKPQNSEFWYTNVLGWLDKYLKPTS